MKRILQITILIHSITCSMSLWADESTMSFNPMTGQKEKYYSPSNHKYEEGGQDFVYRRGNENLTSQGSYIAEKLKRIKEAMANHDESIRDDLLDGFCTDVETTNDCADRYVKVHEFVLYDIQESVRRNKNSIESLKSKGAGIQAVDNTNKAGQSKKPYIPLILKYGDLEKIGFKEGTQHEYNEWIKKIETDHPHYQLDPDKAIQDKSLGILDEGKYRKVVNDINTGLNKDQNSKSSPLKNRMSNATQGQNVGKKKGNRLGPTEKEKQVYIEERNDIVDQLNNKVGEINKKNAAAQASGMKQSKNIGGKDKEKNPDRALAGGSQPPSDGQTNHLPAEKEVNPIQQREGVHNTLELIYPPDSILEYSDSLNK